MDEVGKFAEGSLDKWSKFKTSQLLSFKFIRKLGVFLDCLDPLIWECITKENEVEFNEIIAMIHRRNLLFKEFSAYESELLIEQYEQFYSDLKKGSNFVKKMELARRFSAFCLISLHRSLYNLNSQHVFEQCVSLFKRRGLNFKETFKKWRTRKTEKKEILLLLRTINGEVKQND